MNKIIPTLLALAFGLNGSAFAQVPQAAEAKTKALNEALKAKLPLADQQDFDDARRGFIATIPEGLIKDASGRVVWDTRQYAFLDQADAPASVHPGLWRQARLNVENGLFKVVERIYQIRGFDIANMTIVEGDKGLIIVDPLTVTESAKTALELYFQHRPRRPVVAVIYTHSHADHFGGVRGVIDEADAKSGKVKVIAPSGFLEEAVSENVLAGNAMVRRAAYQFGSHLPRNELGFVDAGLGKTSSTKGTISLIAPNELIAKTIEKHRIDGVDIVFQLTPATEAPAEMHLYFPQFRALNLAENATHTLHNLLPLRGAQVRDANGWAKYLNVALDQFGERSDVLLAQHHWPTWGAERIKSFLARQRDLYKYLHDQTLRLLNQGYTADEIAEQITLPASLQKDWATHGLYGSVKHNVKAIYQRYLGWYDANPANLDPLPRGESSRRIVAYFGGTDAALKKAREDFDKGDYRWVAQVTNWIVFADPENKAARELGARALEQLGYQAESSTWRNAYLQGAHELRNEPPSVAGIRFGEDFLRALSIDNMFDVLAIRVNPERAEGKTVRINWIFKDIGRKYLLNLENAALTYLADKNDPVADVTVTTDKATLSAILGKRLTLQEAYANNTVSLAGDANKLAEVLRLLDAFPSSFPIVTPRISQPPR